MTSLYELALEVAVALGEWEIIHTRRLGKTERILLALGKGEGHRDTIAFDKKFPLALDESM